VREPRLSRMAFQPPGETRNNERSDHLELAGGVLLFLFGLHYRLVPAAGTTTLAKVQGWLHMSGAILFPAGVALVLPKRDSSIGGPDWGIPDWGHGDGAVRGDRVPDLAGLKPRPPGLGGDRQRLVLRRHFLRLSVA
jgi:hypothetical protein